MMPPPYTSGRLRIADSISGLHQLAGQISDFVEELGSIYDGFRMAFVGFVRFPKPEPQNILKFLVLVDSAIPLSPSGASPFHVLQVFQYFINHSSCQLLVEPGLE